jgi:flagellar basal body-associated protein FliL
MSSADDTGSSTLKVILIILGIVAAVILLIVLACGGLFYLGMRQAKQAVSGLQQQFADMQTAQIAAEDFLSDLAAGRIDEAYAQTTQDFRKGQTAQQVRDLVAKNSAVKSSTNRMVSPQNITPNQMRFQVIFQGPTGQTTGSLHVIKEGDKWKVDRFTIP